MHLKGLDKDLRRDEQELVAESVAFVVCGEYGLDAGDRGGGDGGGGWILLEMEHTRPLNNK